MNAFLKGKKANLAGRASIEWDPAIDGPSAVTTGGCLSLLVGVLTWRTFGAVGEAVGAASEWQGHE